MIINVNSLYIRTLLALPCNCLVGYGASFRTFRRIAQVMHHVDREIVTTEYKGWKTSSATVHSSITKISRSLTTDAVPDELPCSSRSSAVDFPRSLVSESRVGPSSGELSEDESPVQLGESHDEIQHPVSESQEGRTELAVMSSSSLVVDYLSESWSLELEIIHTRVFLMHNPRVKLALKHSIIGRLTVGLFGISKRVESLDCRDSMGSDPGHVANRTRAESMVGVPSNCLSRISRNGRLLTGCLRLQCLA